jgi:hypothetical protein
MEKQFADMINHPMNPGSWFHFGEGRPVFKGPDFKPPFGFGNFGWKPADMDDPEDSNKIIKSCC